MTDLIESLLEFSRTRESLRPSYGDVRSAVERAVQGVKAHPEFQRIRIRISGQGSTEGWFDFKKLERVFLNLLLNACEVVPAESGKIDIGLRRKGESLEIRIEDNGRGMADAVRDRLFEPLVSHGQAKWTVMGWMVWSASGVEQEAGNRAETPSPGSVGDSVRELREQVLELQAAVAGMRSDWQRARAETAELRRELDEVRAGSGPRNAVVRDAVATTNTEAAAGSLQDSLQNPAPQDEKQDQKEGKKQDEQASSLEE